MSEKNEHLNNKHTESCSTVGGKGLEPSNNGEEDDIGKATSTAGGAARVSE